MARRILPFVPVSLLSAAPVRQPAQDRQGSLPDPDRPRRDATRSFPLPWARSSPRRPAGPVTTLWIDHADHNDFFEVGGRRIDDAITRFIETHFHRTP